MAKTEAPRPDWLGCQLLRELAGRLPDRSRSFAARAPGRLDLMGGFAEYSGSCVVQTPTRESAYAVLQPRRDGRVAVLLTGDRADGDGCVDLTEFAPVAGGSAGQSLAARIHADASPTRRCVFGTIVESGRAGLLAGLSDGFSIAVSEPPNGAGDLAQYAALSAATLVVIAAASGFALDAVDAAAVCQAVENTWLAAPVGPAGAVCALHGESGAVDEVRCDPCAFGRSVPLPDDYEFVGVDSGVFHDDAMVRYAHARATAFMGRAIVGRIIAKEGPAQPSWDGYLSRISMDDYVDRFRDRIPTKIRGRDFLDQFGETGDPLTRVDPKAVYKVRSRTEHHIYENTRSRHFADSLSRLFQDRDRSTLPKISELMYASHWSYGQRCGLGSIETDLLVNLIRSAGDAAGIHGAKITGRGCGGVVVVFMDATDKARAALDEATKEYTSRTGHHTSYIRGSAAGALLAGAHRL